MQEFTNDDVNEQAMNGFSWPRAAHTSTLNTLSWLYVLWLANGTACSNRALIKPQVYTCLSCTTCVLILVANYAASCKM